MADYFTHFSCLLDVGTPGNAARALEETDMFDQAVAAALEMTDNDNTLIIVTADYHMPRAMLELGSALPGITLQAYPVTTPSLDAQRWWRTTGGARLMVMEYSKYLAILGRELVLRLGPKDEAPPEPASQGG